MQVMSRQQLQPHQRRLQSPRGRAKKDYGVPTFTENVREQWLWLRRVNGIKQGDAARRLGVHQNTLSRWELAKAKLPEAAFNRVISVLAENGITPQEENPKIDIVWVNCPECSQSVPAVIGAQKFHHCAACGEALGKLCEQPTCRHLNRYTAAYCEACGTPLKTHNTNYRLTKDLAPRQAAEDNGQPPK